MMDETTKPKGSWWHTVPGILTAIAGIISAITGLIVAVHQAGIFGEGNMTNSEEKPVIAQQSDPRITKAKELAADVFVITPNHISARGHLESRSPRLCVGSEVGEVEWRNLLRAFRLSEEIMVWSLTLDYYEENMSDGTCLLTLYSKEQASAAKALIGALNQEGKDPPYRAEAFLDIFNDWEIGFE